MTLFYKINTRGNISEIRIVSRRKININALGKLISQMSTVQAEDVVAILHCLADVLAIELARGSEIGLGEIGDFAIAFSAETNLTETPTSDDLIIDYKPGKKLRHAKTTLNLVREE